MPASEKRRLATRRTDLLRVSDVGAAQESSTSCTRGSRLGGRCRMTSRAASSASVHQSGPPSATCCRNCRTAGMGSAGASSSTLNSTA